MNKIITVGREFGSGGREFGCRLAETLGKVAFSMWWFFPHVHQHHRFDAYHHVQPGRLRGDEQLDVATVVLPPVVKHPLLLSEKYRYPVVSTRRGFSRLAHVEEGGGSLVFAAPFYQKRPMKDTHLMKMDEKPAKLEIPSFPVSIRVRMCYDRRTNHG